MKKNCHFEQNALVVLIDHSGITPDVHCEASLQ